MKDIPKVGDQIYVGTHLYLSHGEDDVLGGRATVVFVKPENERLCWVSVAEHPNSSYNWVFLGEEQEALKAEFGNQRARPDPDTREEFNSLVPITRETIKRWWDEGKAQGAAYLIVEDDTFDYTYFPVYVMPDEDLEAKKASIGCIKEIFDLNSPFPY